MASLAVGSLQQLGPVPKQKRDSLRFIHLRAFWVSRVDAISSGIPCSSLKCIGIRPKLRLCAERFTAVDCSLLSVKSQSPKVSHLCLQGTAQASKFQTSWLNLEPLYRAVLSGTPGGAGWLELPPSTVRSCQVSTAGRSRGGLLKSRGYSILNSDTLHFTHDISRT